LDKVKEIRIMQKLLLLITLGDYRFGRYQAGGTG
jgi:hypothetical protein